MNFFIIIETHHIQQSRQIIKHYSKNPKKADKRIEKYNHMKNQQQIDKKFLYKENKQLRLQLAEARQLLKIHKDSVLRLSQPHIDQKNIISILLDLISATQSNKKIEKLNERVLDLESQQMVLQKIVEQTDNDQKQTYHILAEQYNKIKHDNQRLQGQLHKFYQKIGQVDYLSGLVTKYKQVINPTEQAISFKKQQDQLLQFITLQKQAIRRLTQQKNKLLKINIHMKQSVEKHKDQVRNMTMILTNPDMLMNLSMQNNQQLLGLDPNTNILDQLNQPQQGSNPLIGDSIQQPESSNTTSTLTKPQSLPNPASSPLLSMSSFNGNNTSLLNMSRNNNINTTINFIKMQRKIIKEENQDQPNGDTDQQSQEEYDCPQLNILFPDKVEKIKKDKQTAKVPYLNMMKIRQLMAKRDSKIRKQVQAQNRHVNPTDKIIKLETQLQITRKQLTNQTLKFRNMSQELKHTLKTIQQLQHRNQILIASNQRLQTNYRNVYKDYQFTKVVALRVEKAMATRFEDSHHIIQELNSNLDLEDRIKGVQKLLKKVYGRKVVIPDRSQSLPK